MKFFQYFRYATKFTQIGKNDRFTTILFFGSKFTFFKMENCRKSAFFILFEQTLLRQFYVFQHENTLLYDMLKGVLKENITQIYFYANFGCKSTF